MQYCSLQHWTLFPTPVTSTNLCCSCSCSVSSFFLELFLHCSPIAYWAPTNLGSSSFSILSFCLFILFMGFSRQEYWVVCHSLLQWITFCQNSPLWPVLLGLPYKTWLSFIELDNAVFHVVRLVSFLWLWFQSICPLMPSLRAYHLTWVSPTFDMKYLLTAAPAKCNRYSLPWMQGSSSRPLYLHLATVILTQLTIISITVVRNPLEEME